MAGSLIPLVWLPRC